MLQWLQNVWDLKLDQRGWEPFVRHVLSFNCKVIECRLSTVTVFKLISILLCLHDLQRLFILCYFRFSTYPSFVESALWAICFSLFHALCLIHPLIIYLQIENDIKESMKTEMAQLQQSAVHNHTAAMLEMGTNLLSQTAEQTRKLTDVETQVLYPPKLLTLLPGTISRTIDSAIPH